jgi:hypothetical protein
LRQLSFQTDQRPVIDLPESDTLLRRPGTVWIRDCDGSRTSARLSGLTLHLPAPSGLGWMKTMQAPETYAPINLPDGESEIRAAAPQAVADAMQRAFIVDTGDVSETVASVSNTRRKPIWKILACMAIAMLLFESALANRLAR